MSMSAKRFKKRYKRARKSSDHPSSLLEAYKEAQGHSDYDTYDFDDDYYCGPTMEDVRWGHLLWMLEKLQIRPARDILRDWFW